METKHYVAATATGWQKQPPFLSTAERLRGDPEWTVHDLPTGHNVMSDGPEKLLELVLLLA